MTHPTPSTADDLADAALALAKLAVARRHRPRTVAEKRALAASDVLTAIGSNPTLSHALAGGAIGAGLGGLGTLWGGRDREGGHRGLLSGMVTGGLAGAGVGAGAGAIRGGLAAMQRGNRDSAGPGTFAGPSGRKMEISPEVLRQDPELVDRVNALSDESLASQIVRTPIALWNKAREAAPLTTGTMWKGVLPADVLLHNQTLRLGDRAGVGAVTPYHSVDRAHLTRGLAEAGEGGALGRDTANSVLRDSKLLDRIAHDPLRRWHSVITDQGAGTVKPFRWWNPRDWARPKLDHPGFDVPGASDPRNPFAPPTTEHVPAELFRQAKERGARAYGGETSKITKEMPALWRVGGLQGSSGTRGGRIAARLGLYGALPVLEYMKRTVDQSGAQEQDLGEIIRQLRAKGQIKDVGP